MSRVWDDIAYDPVASEELSYQLGAMAAALGESLAAVTDEEARVTDGWHGAYREPSTARWRTAGSFSLL